MDLNYYEPATNSEAELMGAPQLHVPRVPRPNVQDGSTPSQSSESTIIESSQIKLNPQDGRRDVSRFREEPQRGRHILSSNITLALDDLTIPWSELVLKERIGAGESLIFKVVQVHVGKPCLTVRNIITLVSRTFGQIPVF